MTFTPPPSADTGQIKIAVAIPVRNEENSIRTLLDSLLSQTRKPDEIVITDGGSTDATPSIIEHYINEGHPIRLLRTDGALPGRGRNLAAAAAKCDWLAFTDAGIRLERDWLEALAEQAVCKDADAVYGAWEPVTDSFFKECAAIAYVPPPILSDGTPIRSYFIASALIRRKVWQAVGGFPEHLRSAEDLLFMNRIEAGGFRVVRAPRALVHWNVQQTLWRTFKRFSTYSRHNIRAGLFSSWQAAIFKRYLLLLLLFAPAFWFGYKYLALPLAVWLLMLLARAVVALRRNRRAYPASLSRNAARLAVLLPLLAVLDAAAIVGAINWLLKDKFQLNGAALDTGKGA